MFSIQMKTPTSIDAGSRSLVLASLLTLSMLTPMAHAGTAVQSGDWSDSATWGGAVPSGIEEDNVIPAGIDVLLDMDVECGELLVNGRLEVEAADRTLTCDSLIVQGTTAEFVAGTDISRAGMDAPTSGFTSRGGMRNRP